MGPKKSNTEEEWHSPSNFGLASEAFWDIFNHGSWGIAVTDRSGNFLFANTLYNELLVNDHVDFKSNVDDLKVLLPSPDWTQFKLVIGVNSFLIQRAKISNNLNGPSLIWFVAKDPHAGLVNKLGLLKNVYRSFIATTFESILRTDKQGKILFTNRLFLKSFGFDNYKAVKGMSVQAIFEDVSVYHRLKELVERNKHIASERVSFKKSNGNRLIGTVNGGIFFDQTGQPVINWTILDISNQVESEHRLRSKNEELAKVNNQMEKFLYSTSHDLRSPITSVMGLVNLMRIDAKDPVLVDYINKIEVSTMRLDKIIRDIMSFSKNSYARSYSEKIDFNAVFWKTINAYRDEPAVRKINFEVKCNTLFPFYTDPERLEIIVDNIIRNAINFYDDNKTRPFVRVSVTLNREKAVIEILDNGIGIGQQHRENVFKMFYKASHLSKGAGLGLFIVRETVEKLQGLITLESEVGFGTVLHITIPNDPKGKLISRKMDLKHSFGEGINVLHNFPFSK